MLEPRYCRITSFTIQPVPAKMPAFAPHCELFSQSFLRDSLQHLLASLEFLL